MNHFTYGPLTPGLAFLMSCTGACLGLLCSARAQAMSGFARGRWIAMAAVSLGGTGIWVMHFIAMLGFSIPGQEVRYDIPLTLASLLLSVLVVGIGLTLAIGGESSTASLLVGGVITGSGVGAMHYLGMYAMKTTQPIGYDPRVVSLSMVIAIVAATAALWAALHVRGAKAISAAVPVMGLAVCGMHYTGMFAMHRTGTGSAGAHPHGTDQTTFFAPMITSISVLTMIILVIVAIWPNVEQMEDDRDFDDRVARLTAGGVPHTAS
ncbi:MHYT domain-containing protein [Yinghuangia seranimata]|uniref:MHYT domain-containing protein n=1 Tax=Yinghuangia seranimata TaxID=408067 RepID=UPI00248C15B8|nr:MHYT domain-containing protein [Yinghuangia seranimata]MDI2130236.1 MHYT domain-containing protein [Yinghuangia seranimata]